MLTGVQPSYRKLHESGELANRRERLYERLADCVVCAQHCHVNRLKGERGFCRAGEELVIASYGPHFGEERPLVGRYGSGAIFLAFCNLACVFCQNFEISHEARGEGVTPAELAGMMVDLQEQRCHNINFVTPSHYVPQIVAAVEIAAENGLRIPLVYNCGGYESLETLRLLNGVFDIYMPDIKYDEAEVAWRLSRARAYPEVARNAVREMHRQVGDLILDEDGIAVRGLIVRHLVLPGELAGTEGTMRFLAEEISRDTYVNVMDQYHPCYRAFDQPPLDRSITRREFTGALQAARRVGLYRFAD